MSGTNWGYKDGVWISHFYRRKPLVDMIDTEWKKDKLFADDITIPPELEAKATAMSQGPKEKSSKLWESTGLQKMNGDQIL